MVAVPPSTFLNVLGSLSFTFTLPIILLAFVLRTVLLAVVMTRMLVLLPPPRNIGVTRRRRRMIVGPHLGCGASFGFLLNTCLVKLNRNKTVMLNQDVTKLQMQVEVAGIGFLLRFIHFLYLSASYLILSSMLILSYP